MTSAKQIHEYSLMDRMGTKQEQGPENPELQPALTDSLNLTGTS
jgi:hypothetical protein